MNQLFLKKAWRLMAMASVLAGCGSNSGPKEPQTGALRLNGTEYIYVDKGTLTSTDASVTGTGSLVFRDALISEDNNFAITFSLEDGGSVTLAALSDRTLKNGVSLTIARSGNNLKVTLSAKGKTDDVSTDFAGVAADKPLSLFIDVHGHGDVLVDGVGDMLGYQVPKGPYGTLWGLSLTKATVTQALATKPKHPH